MILICFVLVTHAKHGEPNAGLGHDEHGALDDARRLDVPPASRTHQETANQNIAAAVAASVVRGHLLSYYLVNKRSFHVRSEGLEIPTLIGEK